MVENMSQKKLGFNNLVISIGSFFEHPRYIIDGKDVHEYIKSHEGLVAISDPLGVYIVKEELADELTKNGVEYHVEGKFPMPRKVREKIRKNLKDRGVSAPV